MTGVETIARIRFEHFQNCKGIKRIARELGIARDTVRKVLRSGATEFSYKRERPSSDDLRHVACFRKGGSGSSVIEIMRHAVDAASDGLRLSGV